MDGLCRRLNHKDTVNECKYDFVTYVFLHGVKVYGNGFTSKMIKSCNSLKSCSFGHLFSFGFVNVALVCNFH